jgi:uncharacterized small protein (DUF1192 family)
MTTIAITPALKVTMLKHLVAGKDLDFVATVTKVPRDDVLDIASKHGYPNHDRMAWAIDMLIQGGDKIPERPADHRPKVLLDEPATRTTNICSDQRPGSLAITPPATIAHVPPATADLLHQAEQSPFIRTQNIGTKISALLADLTTRLTDEQQQVEAKAQADREAARIASRIATLQAEIDKLKRKPAKTATARAAATTGNIPRSERLTRGVHPCTTAGCDRTFDTPQGAVTHRRRAHEGFNPHAGAA